MRLGLILVGLCLAFQTNAQKVFWASKVLGFSTEALFAGQTTEYRAIQALGRPNKLPQYGSTTCAWQPSTQDNPGDEWIKVMYDTLMPIRQVVIAENIGQGCITKILAYDEGGKEHAIYENAELPSSGSGKLLTIILPEMTPFKVSAIKLVLNTARVKGWNQIDAIGVSQADKPIEVLINVNKDTPMDIVKENLGAGVNSKAHELAPVIAPDGKTLYFTRWNHPDNMGEIDRITKKKNQDVWYSKLEAGGVWGEAQNLGEPINNADNNAICSISTDGKTILLINIYRPDGTLAKGLSKSKRQRNGWTFPTEVKIKNYQNESNYSEFSLSPDGKVLVMTAQAKETFGSKDLYVSFLQPDSSWSEPRNMGPSINTAEAESTPFVAADNKTLYFSTAGHAGYGSNDIFLTRRLDETWTKWSAPENLGAAINTPEWDGYFTIPASGDYAYLCSQEESLGLEDIYRLKLYPAIKPEPVAIISGNVYDFVSKKPIGADVLANVLVDNKEVGKTDYDPQTGEYKMVVPLRETYSIIASKKGYMPLSESIDLAKEKNYREIKKNLYLIPIAPGQKIVLNHVFFEQSKFELLPASYPELDRILQIMKDNPTVEIQLEGHTDNQGDFNLNLQLSQDRVTEVKKYLTSKGIDEKRISVKGWGSTKPVASNVTEDKRKLNRRVEFVVVKM
ncbi:MAG: OmpA family protein [Spirosomataceae bacterium]